MRPTRPPKVRSIKLVSRLGAHEHPSPDLPLQLLHEPSPVVVRYGWRRARLQRGNRLFRERHRLIARGAVTENRATSARIHFRQRPLHPFQRELRRACIGDERGDIEHASRRRFDPVRARGLGPANAEKNNAREAASQNQWRRDTARKGFMIIIRSAIELPHNRRRNRAPSPRRHDAACSAGSISVGPDATSRSDLLRDP